MADTFPLVPLARFTVTCACGFAVDSDADDADMARAEVAERHDHAHHSSLTVTTLPDKGAP